MNETLAAPATGATSKNNQDKLTSIPTKHELCIHELLKAGTDGINQLTALSTYFDTCLNTTVSELGLKRNLTIEREKRQHIHSAGGVTYFCWYWFATRGKAQQGLDALNLLREQRKVAHLTEFESSKLLERFPETFLKPVA